MALTHSTYHKRLLPLRSLNESDVVPFFSLVNTGEMGTLVTLVASNWDNKNGFDFNNAPGAAYDRVYSFRYKNNLLVRPSQSGDAAKDILGLTLQNVSETDENGEKYIYNEEKARENSTVISGQSVNIARRGIFSLSHLGYSNPTGTGDNNLPQVGDLVVPSATAAGKIYCAAASEVGPRKIYDISGSTLITTNNTSVTYFDDQVIGRVIGTGSKNGPYVVFELGR